MGKGTEKMGYSNSTDIMLRGERVPLQGLRDASVDTEESIVDRVYKQMQRQKKKAALK
jgi:hypothetical protein